MNQPFFGLTANKQKPMTIANARKVNIDVRIAEPLIQQLRLSEPLLGCIEKRNKSKENGNQTHKCGNLAQIRQIVLG